MKGFGLGVGLSSLIFLAAFGFFAFVERQQPAINGPTTTETQHNVQDIAAETVAYYTEVLAWFTGALAFVSVIQGIFLYRSDKTARIAAEAARSSAVAAIGVEIPKLFIGGIELYIAGAGNFEAQIQYARATITVKNYGRTPAFLRQQSVETKIAAWLPVKPEYPSAYDLEPGVVIEHGKPYELPTARWPFMSIEEIADAISGKTQLSVYGYISYLDFLGDPHRLKFCASLYIPDSAASQRGISARFIQGGPEGYEENW